MRHSGGRTGFLAFEAALTYGTLYLRGQRDNGAAANLLRFFPGSWYFNRPLCGLFIMFFTSDWCSRTYPWTRRVLLLFTRKALAHYRKFRAKNYISFLVESFMSGVARYSWFTQVAVGFADKCNFSLPNLWTLSRSNDAVSIKSNRENFVNFFATRTLWYLSPAAHESKDFQDH